jgi:hypothetical protein
MNLDFKNMTSEDMMALIVGIFFNLNLRVYDNGLSIAENVLNNMDLKDTKEG